MIDIDGLLYRHNVHGGTQLVFRFPNGYGASVVCHDHSYGGSAGLWELAVLKYYDDADGFNLDYTTAVADDVLGHLTDERVNGLLRSIAALRASGAPALSASVVNPVPFVKQRKLRLIKDI